MTKARAFAILSLTFFLFTAFKLNDEGVQVNPNPLELNCVGNGIVCSGAGITGTLTVAGSSAYLALDNSNQASWTPTTTLVTNLNADLLDGKSTGTSGSAIPVLNAANTWGAAQNMGNFIISNIGNALTDFNSNGGLTLADTLTVNANPIGGNGGATINRINSSLDAALTLKQDSGITTNSAGDGTRISVFIEDDAGTSVETARIDFVLTDPVEDQIDADMVFSVIKNSLLYEVARFDADADGLQFADSKYLLLGTANDAKIYYDAVDLVLSPREVGTGAVKIGVAAAGVDYVLKFDGETNDGSITWLEDEAQFKFTSEIFVTKAGNPIELRNTTDAAVNQAGKIYGNQRATAAVNDEAYLSFFLQDSAGGASDVESARLIWVMTNPASSTPTTDFKIQIRSGSSGLIDILKVDGSTQSLVFDTNKGIVMGNSENTKTYYNGTQLVIDPNQYGLGTVWIGDGADSHMKLGDIEIDGALNHDGTTVGFYNVTPTTRQVLATGAGKTVDEVITALQTLGLVSQT